MEEIKTDERKYNVTNKIFEVLNNVKGFDVAMTNPRKGKIIVRYEGVSFYLNIEPIFNDNDEGREMDSKPFEYIAETHKWVFR